MNKHALRTHISDGNMSLLSAALRQDTPSLVVDYTADALGHCLSILAAHAHEGVYPINAKDLAERLMRTADLISPIPGTKELGDGV